MKRTLHLKFIAAYIAFVVTGIIIIATFTYRLTFQYVERREASSLYRESAMISSTYASNYFSREMTLDETLKQLKSLAAYHNSDIWIVDTKGNVILNTADTSSDGSKYSIADFDIADFGNRYYQTGHFYGTFEADTLSVYSPITVNYKVRGYVILHKPVSAVISNSNDLAIISYQTFGLVCAAAFVIILSIILSVYRPLLRIIKGAEHYADGHFEQKIGINRNDELGALSASLDYMANELNTLEDDQKKFISNVSHDFRSPLTSIKGYVEAMLDGTIPPELQEKYLGIILFETERLNKLTQGLLELNRYGSHGIRLDISNFDINYTIRMTVQTFEGTCKQKHISFDLILTGETLFVSGDMSKIQQVLYNLIDNAIKFSHPDSTITIETTEKNEKVFTSVKDTGIGIPKDSVNKIWDRFYKTDLSRGKDKKGTGLGLSIVKEIVLAHNENISCVSTEGVGTKFIFSLPVALSLENND